MLSTHAVDGKPLWIDLLLPTEEEMEQVNRQFGVRVPSKDELSEIESSSRLAKRGDQLYLSMPLLPPERGDPMAPPLGFVFSPTLLITVRFSELNSIERLASEFGTKFCPPDSAHVFLALLERMVDHAADLLEQQNAELAKTSRSAFQKRSTSNRNAVRSTKVLQATLIFLGRTGERLSQTRDTLLGLQRIAPFAADGARDWLKGDLVAGLHLVQRDLASLTDFESHLSNKVQFLLDAILGFINTEQNEIFKVLTIASVVGIPPTLVASMYGMNFKNMPELSWSWGYEYGLALIAISTILPILWFKSRGWW